MLYITSLCPVSHIDMCGSVPSHGAPRVLKQATTTQSVNGPTALESWLCFCAVVLEVRGVLHALGGVCEPDVPGMLLT